MILTEYIIRTEKEEDNPLKNRKVINNTKEKINIIENYFSKAQLNRNMENIEYENESDNSDKETERKITIFRNSEIDEDDEEEDRFSEENINKTRSKKVINKKILEGEHKTAEYPEFYAECKFYGEGKERYHVKIIIDSSFNLNFSPEMKKGFKSYSLYYYQFPLLSIKNYNSKYFRFAHYYYNIYTKKRKEYIDGWTIYNPEKEYEKQELDFNDEFRIIDNSKYNFCSTYAKQIIVPKSISDEDIKKASEYRTKERFPALTYRYKKNGKCIWRSSQTKSGIKGKTNKDVVLLTTIANNSKKLYIYDARPLLNAWANKLKGAGYEDTSQYSDINIELIFCGIPNIHVVRRSCHKVYSNIYFKNENEEKKKPKNTMESGNWYDSIIILIKGSFQICDTIKSNNTVLIHCSDGWDRTTQLCCISQLILDKRYRTIDGFICLIEKDWLSFGHQFRYRCGMYCPSDSPSNIASENQKSPIFIQWLDAVYQIMIQNYNKFEFNSELLYFLANEIYTGKYGTFLFNNEQEREKFNARKNTLSIWNYVKENEYKFINPIYEPKDDSPFIMNYKRIQLWNKYFFRFENGDNNYDEKITKVFKELNNKIEKDKNIIDDLVKFINKNCSKADLNSLNEETKNLLKGKLKNK